jgi:hypothetical protein
MRIQYKAMILIICMCFSCSKWNNSFNLAKLGLTLDEAIELWGEPTLKDKSGDNRIFSWQNENCYVLSLWYKKEEEKSFMITPDLNVRMPLSDLGALLLAVTTGQ